MNNIYRIVLMSVDPTQENSYFSEDFWLVESSLDIMKVYDYIEEFNNRMKDQGYLLAVDEEKALMSLNDFTYDTVLKSINK